MWLEQRPDECGRITAVIRPWMHPEDSPQELTPAPKNLRRRNRRKTEDKDVLVSAVISTYLLTHLHYVLQRAEYGAAKEGRREQAVNFAQLRKVLCMDARSMKDASATGMKDGDIDTFHDSRNQSKAA